MIFPYSQSTTQIVHAGQAVPLLLLFFSQAVSLLLRNLEPFFPIQGEQQHQHKIITKVIPQFGDELKQVECLPVLTGLDTGFKYGRSS